MSEGGLSETDIVFSKSQKYLLIILHLSTFFNLRIHMLAEFLTLSTLDTFNPEWHNVTKQFSKRCVIIKPLGCYNTVHYSGFGFGMT